MPPSVQIKAPLPNETIGVNPKYTERRSTCSSRSITVYPTSFTRVSANYSRKQSALIQNTGLLQIEVVIMPSIRSDLGEVMTEAVGHRKGHRKQNRKQSLSVSTETSGSLSTSALVLTRQPQVKFVTGNRTGH